MCLVFFFFFSYFDVSLNFGKYGGPGQCSVKVVNKMFKTTEYSAAGIIASTLQFYWFSVSCAFSK